MFEFLSNAEPLLKGFWYVALVSSLIFLIQTIMTFLGGGDTDGISADFDGNLDHVDAPFQFFSFRNLINFLLGFGWTGVAFYQSISNQFLLIALAVVVGLVMVFLFFLLIKQILKLSEDNTFNIQKAVNLNGEVYVPIPENMTGKGKIQLSVNGSFVELSAMTEHGEKLSTGTVVKVDKVVDEVLIVKKIN